MKHHKSVSVIVSFILISLIVISGPAQAVQIKLSEPNNAMAGKEVKFKFTLKTEVQDSYVPFKVARIVINGPEKFRKVCDLDLNGNILECDLDLKVRVEKDTNYGEGYGYGNKDGSLEEFGYGYGYGYQGREGVITYIVSWKTPTNLKPGQYRVISKVLAQNNNNEEVYKSNEVKFEISKLENLYECREGMVYFDTHENLNNASLYRVNLENGEATFKQFFEGNFRHNVAINSEGEVYAIKRSDDGSISETLVILHADGSHKEVGKLNIINGERINALGFDVNDELYGMGPINNAIYKIDTDTGLASFFHVIEKFKMVGGDLVIAGDEELVYVQNNGEVWSVNLKYKIEEYLGTMPGNGNAIYTGLALVEDVFYTTLRGGNINSFTLNPFETRSIGHSGVKSGDAASCPSESRIEFETHLVCHLPLSGEFGKPFTIEVRNSQLKEHLKHGDYLGKCIDNSAENEKTLVCHIPKGNPENAHTIKVNKNAVEAHLKHGDYLGECRVIEEELFIMCYVPLSQDNEFLIPYEVEVPISKVKEYLQQGFTLGACFS